MLGLLPYATINICKIHHRKWTIRSTLVEYPISLYVINYDNFNVMISVKEHTRLQNSYSGSIIHKPQSIGLSLKSEDWCLSICYYNNNTNNDFS